MDFLPQRDIVFHYEIQGYLAELLAKSLQNDKENLC